MSRRRWAAACLALACLALAAAAVRIVVDIATAKADARLALSSIAQVPWKNSRARLEPLSRRLGARSSAGEGLAVLAAVMGSENPRLPPADPALFELPLRSIFDRAIEERRYFGVLSLADRVETAGSSAFAEYRAAALLELGRADEARSVDLKSESRTRLGRRLAEILAADDPQRLPVRDRKGEILGWMGAGGGDFVLRR